MRAFQAERGITADGVFGAQTSAALHRQLASKALMTSFDGVVPGQATPSTEAVEAPAPSTDNVPLTPAVVEPATPEATAPASGEEGKATEAAQASGGTASATQSGEATGSGGGTPTPEAAAPETAAAPATQAGSAEAAQNQQAEEGRVHAVQQLQAALHLPVDGDFGPETEAAVRRLQARHGLTVDGVVGPGTWSLIGVQGKPTLTPPASALAKPAAKPAATPAAPIAGGAPAANATPPNSQEAVQWLQAALHIPVDGEFGPETEAAVRRLQARHGLDVDGVVGPATWSLIGVKDAPTLTPPASALATPAPAAAGGAPDSSAPGAGDEGEAAAVVARVIAAANEIATRPYVYGGGHGSFISEGYDCSGSVSYALHGGGLLSAPEDSGELESYGEAGPGRYITIYANAEHAYMVIDGRRFDTVALAEDGTRWSDSPGDDGGSFVVRHPDGL